MADLEKNKQPSRFGTGVETDTIRYSAAHTTFIYKVSGQDATREMERK